LPLARKRWGPSSTDRRASAWTTRPWRAASPRSPNRSTSGQEAAPRGARAGTRR
jgi:hypothetical protein